MRTQYLSIRVTPEQKQKIKELANGNLSTWSIKKLLPFDDLVRPVKPRQIVNEALDNHFKPKSIILPTDVKPKCAICSSRDTFPVDRRGTIFHLCQTHKP